MGRRHDQPSGLLAPASGMPPGVDPLSDVLRTVRLTGALFFLVDASSPWTVELPEGSALARALLPRTQHVISYHVVTGGACWGGLLDGVPIRLESGDVLVFPHGDPYFMSLAPARGDAPEPAEALALLKALATGELASSLVEGGGGPEEVRLVCGFLGCDVRPFNPLLATLPRVLHVRAPGDAPGDSLGALVELAAAESREPRAGGDCIRLRLSELMFVEVVRRHLATRPPGEAGWLGGLRDPNVGRALGVIHERPAEPWTLETLARDAGLSRSTLALRFAHFVGHPPMQYLTRWRMQVAARLLADGAAKVAAVAAEVGYESEAAFSRAFKKVAGVPPASWRRRASR